MRRAVTFMLLLLPGLSVAATELTREELSECAEIVIQLRGRSPELQQQAADANGRRAELGRMHAALEPGSAGDTDRWLRYNAAAAAFNERMEQFRLDVIAINAVKQRYQSQCDGRPYDRGHLESLSSAGQDAMRRGMADVKIPFLAPR